MKKGPVLLGAAGLLGLLLLATRASVTASAAERIDAFYNAGKITDHNVYLALRLYFQGRYDLSTDAERNAMMDQITAWWFAGAFADYDTYLAIFYMV